MAASPCSTALRRMLGDKDPAKTRRVTEAMMMKMVELDIASLERAYAGA
jgi:hypothetical protein